MTLDRIAELYICKCCHRVEQHAMDGGACHVCGCPALRLDYWYLAQIRELREQLAAAEKENDRLTGEMGFLRNDLGNSKAFLAAAEQRECELHRKALDEGLEMQKTVLTIARLEQQLSSAWEALRKVKRWFDGERGEGCSPYADIEQALAAPSPWEEQK